MNFLLRFILAIVFAIAGGAKLVDIPGSRSALRNFGVPERLLPPLGILLPLVEFAVAIALLFTETAWWGAIGGLILLSLFIIGIAVNLARGKKPDCHCFGQLHSAPIGWQTLVRNGLLLTLAGVIVLQGPENVGPSFTSYLSVLTGAQLMGLVFAVVGLSLFALEGWFILHLMQQNGRLLLRMDALETALNNNTLVSHATTASTGVGLPVGVPAPGFTLSDLHGDTVTLDALRAPHKPVLLVFSDPSCGPCTALLPDVSRWQREYADKLSIALISRGSLESNRAKSVEHSLTQVLLQHDREVAQAYQANGTPGAVLVGSDGTIGSKVAMGAPAISALVAQTVGVAGVPALQAAPVAERNGSKNGTQAASTATPSVHKIGQRAPALKLPDLNGKTVDLKDFRGTNTLVLFWNPGCGFCQRMLEDLKTWEAEVAEGTPKLLVVSTGTTEANKTMGLRSPVVLEPAFTIGRLFGASGTPSAVLVDAKGKIASEVAVGASAVLEMARGNQSRFAKVQV